MRTIITLPDQLHAKSKSRAAELGISLSEFVRRVLTAELDAPSPQGDIDSICGFVSGAPFDMARDGDGLIAEATVCGAA
ncbi:MAG: hypothetical protein OXI48_06985 [bacterium]|nr:hypothetical protein [bacterium]